MTGPQRHGLGRGLSSLIPKTGAGTAAGIETVDIDLIVPNPQQPRTHFDPAALQELADSIREHGVLQPVLVTQVRSEMGMTTYQLIAGERRLQASRMAGLERMPVVIKEAADAAMLELALVENLQRQDLNPIEEAQAFVRLSDEFGMTQEQIAARLGWARTRVANRMRLLLLQEDIQQSLASGQINEGHARALMQIEDAGTRLDAWRRIVSDALTVRQAEDIARALKAVSGSAPAEPGRAPSASAGSEQSAHLRLIERDLREALGARVAVTGGKRGGRILITYHSEEELDGILRRIIG